MPIIECRGGGMSVTEENTEQDKMFMQQAQELAAHAENLGEIPVGAIIVHQGQVISKGYNQSITLNDPSAHAEILALRAAGKALNNYRLLDTTLYVTLEPCAMCAMAMVHARVGRVVFGAFDYKTGAGGSLLNLLTDSRLNHQLTVCSGVLGSECSEQLSQFFRRRRLEKKQLKNKTI